MRILNDLWRMIHMLYFNEYKELQGVIFWIFDSYDTHEDTH